MATTGKSIERAVKTRYGADFSISAVARDLGMSRGYLSLVLSGKRPPSAKLRRALSLTPPKPRGIRVRMSVAEAIDALAGEPRQTTRERIQRALQAGWSDE